MFKIIFIVISKKKKFLETLTSEKSLYWAITTEQGIFNLIVVFFFFFSCSNIENWKRKLQEVKNKKKNVWTTQTTARNRPKTMLKNKRKIK
jgi:hypothetical protein